MEIRPLTTLDEIDAAAAIFKAVWKAPQREQLPHNLLRALTAHSNVMLGAYADGRLVGAVLGWWGRDQRTREPFLFSQKLGVLKEHRGTGASEALKRAQARLAAQDGVRELRWTFDPMRSLNAAFNLRKLGAVGIAFNEDLYGPREDSMNAGERTDRMLVSWRPADPPPEPGRDVRRVRIPADYADYHTLPLKQRRLERDHVRDALRVAFDAGYRAVDFERPDTYVLAREGRR